MNWKDLVELLKGHKTYIQTHNFPDPDALGSAYGLQQFLKYHGVETSLCYDGSISTLSARKMIEEFEIEVTNAADLPEMKEEDYIVLVDGQKYNANFTDLIGDEVACIDHHPTFVECEYKYSDIRLVGACSSLIAEYYYKSNTPIEEKAASALMYGLRMDTASLTRGVTQLDIDMFSYLYKYTDNDKITMLYINTMEMDDLKAYGAAIENIKVVESIGFAHIPFECNDALIAMISDFILSLNEVSACVVYANREGGYKISVRSVSEHIHSGKLIADALEGIGNGGGHAAMAGGVIYKEKAEDIRENIEEVVKDRFLAVIRSGNCENVR